jgi:membrane-associated phospholipid phosphatase
MNADSVFLARVESPAEPRAEASSERFLRGSECLLIAFFVLTAVRAATAGSFTFAWIDLCVPLIFLGLAWTGQRVQRKWFSVVRDWTAMPFLILAYWNADWVAPVHSTGSQENRWIHLDRLLLDDWGGRRAIESLGILFPSLLEFAYLALYALPPVLLGIIYLRGRRRSADLYLFTLFAGALTTYALLPWFPLVSPRQMFAGQDLPTVWTVFGSINRLLLDSLDIRCGVFPSGHVTVAFSAAFGMMRVMPERRWLHGFLLLFATLVMMNTIYARYHYAIDGIAGLAISLAAFGVSRKR